MGVYIYIYYKSHTEDAWQTEYIAVFFFLYLYRSLTLIIDDIRYVTFIRIVEEYQNQDFCKIVNISNPLPRFSQTVSP